MLRILFSLYKFFSIDDIKLRRSDESFAPTKKNCYLTIVDSSTV